MISGANYILDQDTTELCMYINIYLMVVLCDVFEIHKHNRIWMNFPIDWESTKLILITTETEIIFMKYQELSDINGKLYIVGFCEFF